MVPASREREAKPSICSGLKSVLEKKSLMLLYAVTMLEVMLYMPFLRA